MSEYFYKDGKYSHGLFGWYFYDTPRDRTQYRIQSWLSGMSPVMDGYYRNRDNMAYMDDYMRNRGVSWSNVKYPSRTVGWSAGSSAGHTVRSVSRNVTSLYRY